MKRPLKKIVSPPTHTHLAEGEALLGRVRLPLRQQEGVGALALHEAANVAAILNEKRVCFGLFLIANETNTTWATDPDRNVAPAARKSRGSSVILENPSIVPL